MASTTSARRCSGWRGSKPLGYGEQTLLSGVTARLAADALPTGASLHDLGTHRPKDLGEPEHVYQLDHPDLRTEFPALKSLDSHPHNLPVQLSSFVGREAEVAGLGQLLAAQRLLTLLGPGGIGKTRLALQVAAEQVEAFPDGVFLVDLAPIRDPELVPGAIAAALGRDITAVRGSGRGKVAIARPAGGRIRAAPRDERAVGAGSMANPSTR